MAIVLIGHFVFPNSRNLVSIDLALSARVPTKGSRTEDLFRWKGLEEKPG